MSQTTHQRMAIPGSKQIENSAGGCSWEVTDWTRLDRFLILGSESPTYYASAQTLTQENAVAVRRCLESDGPEAVRRIVAVSLSGRAPKNDYAIFALALAASAEAPTTRAAALEAVPKVCRTGTHLFQFAEAVQSMRGWGRALRHAVSRWYLDREARDLAYQAVKYQQRNKWTHRDLLRLAHPRAIGAHQDVLQWIVKGWETAAEQPPDDAALIPIWAMEKAKRAESSVAIVRLIRDHALVRECIPTRWLTERAVWDALLERMPMTAMIRNLATMTRVGLLTNASKATRAVVTALADTERLRKARVHPIAALAALKTYSAGHGDRGKSTWTPVKAIVDVLDGAFYRAFGAVQPNGKRWLLALDVSGSMTCGSIAGVPGLTPRVGSAAMALITAAVEERHQFIGFTGGSEGVSPLKISPRDRLDTVCERINRLDMGPTDCALPMIHAMQQKSKVDVFVVYTDSETWFGKIHPCQALQRYREQSGIPARLIVCGMVANKFSIADPGDAGQLDVVGFDTATPQLMSNFALGDAVQADEPVVVEFAGEST